MKRKSAFFLIMILAIILSACATAATQAPAQSLSPMDPSASANRADYDGAGAPAPEISTGQQKSADVTRLVIKNAELIIVVDDPFASMATIMEMANQMEGYVVSSRSFKTTAENGVEVPQATVAVRVPAERLDEALALIRKLTNDPAQDIRSENVTGDDITSDYVDLQSQLTNLQNTEIQLQRIQDSATKTEDVLNVFTRLTDIRQQIEQIKGKMKYYEESAALSSISVSLLSKAGIAPISIGGWEPVGEMRNAIQSLIDVGKFLGGALIWIVLFFLPIGLVLYFPGRWIWRLIKRRQPVPKAYQPIADAPQYPPVQGPPPQYPDIK